MVGQGYARGWFGNPPVRGPALGDAMVGCDGLTKRLGDSTAADCTGFSAEKRSVYRFPSSNRLGKTPVTRMSCEIPGADGGQTVSRAVPTCRRQRR